MSHLNRATALCTNLDMLEEVVRTGFKGKLNWKKQSTFASYGNSMVSINNLGAEYSRVVAAISSPMAHHGFEVGVVELKKGGYALLFDSMDQGLCEAVGNGAGKLMDEYAKAQIRHEAMLRGYMVEEEIKEDGTIHLIAAPHEQ